MEAFSKVFSLLNILFYFLNLQAGGSNIKSLYQEENLLENSSENAPIENEDTTKKTPVTMPMPKNLGGAPKKVSRVSTINVFLKKIIGFRQWKLGEVHAWVTKK